MSVASDARGTELSVTVWYPAETGDDMVTLGENIFFEGTPAMRAAPVSDGQFPLILLSHGAGLAGTAAAMSWIATPLAQQGFIVAAPTHPGNTGPDRSAAETMKLWLRASDLSETLDALEDHPEFRPHIALDRIGVLGLSMGGNTALSIAGARLDPDLFARYCDTDDRNASLCDWVRQSGVDLHAMDMAAAARDNADPRVRFVMAIDPAPSDIFAPETFADIAIPVFLVNLGAPSEIPATVRAAGLADAIPGAAYAVLEEASHASMFALCKPGAAEIAVEEGIEDPICTDGSGPSRAAIHARLVDMAATAFGTALGTGD